MNKPEFIVDGITLPTPSREGVEITPNRLWSSNAGRNSSTGRFVGDIIAVKYTVKLTYETLSEEEMQLLWNLTANLTAWHTLDFPLNGSVKTMTCYISDVTYTLRRFNMKLEKAFYKGVTVEMIEQ
ncbi:MAG: hypothetical protein LIO40_05580 [Ruminococcus sp.]|nr:hypothetical protein [Ruminococcus sp.]